MGLLDDLAKAEWGKPAGEGIADIAKAQRERAAFERGLPIVEAYLRNREAPSAGELATPENIATMQDKSIADLIGSGVDPRTAAFQQMSKSITESGTGQINALKTGADIGKTRAETTRTFSEASNLDEETRRMAEIRRVSQSPFKATGDPYVDRYISQYGTMGESAAASQAIEPFLRLHDLATSLELSRMKGRQADDDAYREFAAMANKFFMPKLPPGYQDLGRVDDIIQVLSGSAQVSDIAKGILQRKHGKDLDLNNPEVLKDYNAVANAVGEAYAAIHEDAIAESRSKLPKDQQAGQALMEAYQAALDSYVGDTPPTPQEFLDSGAGYLYRQMTGQPEMSPENKAVLDMLETVRKENAAAKPAEEKPFEGSKDTGERRMRTGLGDLLEYLSGQNLRMGGGGFGGR